MEMETETALVPYGYEFEDEEPPIIEGEFREVPEFGEELWEIPIEEELGEDREERKRREQLAGEIERLEKLEKERSLLARKAKIEELKSIQRKYKRQYRPSVPEKAKKLQQILTLGGPPAKKGLVEHRELYVPKAGKGMYVPTGMQRLTSVAPAEGPSRIGEPLKEVTAPKLGRLQRAGAPGTGLRTPIAKAAVPSRSLTHPTMDLEHLRVRGDTVSLGMLREASMPRGLSMVERAAYAEIMGNGDRDTVKHISSELSALGFSRKDTGTAIGSLVQKGLVKPTYEARGEEAVMEVVR